jgi:hypothetical protein
MSLNCPHRIYYIGFYNTLSARPCEWELVKLRVSYGNSGELIRPSERQSRCLGLPPASERLIALHDRQSFDQLGFCQVRL